MSFDESDSAQPSTEHEQPSSRMTNGRFHKRPSLNGSRQHRHQQSYSELNIFTCRHVACVQVLSSKCSPKKIQPTWIRHLCANSPKNALQQRVHGPFIIVMNSLKSISPFPSESTCFITSFAVAPSASETPSASNNAVNSSKEILPSPSLSKTQKACQQFSSCVADFISIVAARNSV